MRRWSWQAVRNCPGRYILPAEQFQGSPQGLAGPDIDLREFDVETARDTVVVASLDSGGLISYKRADGTYLHTLNTPEGFRRKLNQLGIDREKTEQDRDD